jgi:hypothetical protein
VAPEPRVGVRSPFRQSLPQTHASDAVEPTAFSKSNYTSARRARTVFYLRFRPPSHGRSPSVTPSFEDVAEPLRARDVQAKP